MAFTKQNLQEPFIILLREGTPEDPYVPITETIKLVDAVDMEAAVYNIAILRELPLQTQGVEATVVNGAIELIEIRDSLTEIDATHFKVDYTNGRVYLSKEYSNEAILFEYKGRGAIFVSGERIILSYGGNTLEDLYSLDDYVREHLGEINVGNLNELNTVAKDKIVHAINEVWGITTTHNARTDNPHNVTKAQIGLPDVDNDIQSQVDALKGAYIYIGVISLNTADVTQALLTARAKEIMSTTTVQGGWVLLDLEQHEWYYQDASTTWIDMGQANIYPATNSNYGTVKGNSNVSIAAGEMTVNNSADSVKLGGELPIYYAKQSDLNNIKELGDIIATYQTGVFTELDFSIPGNYIVRGGTGFVTGTPDDTAEYYWNITVLSSNSYGITIIAKHNATQYPYLITKYGSTWSTEWSVITKEYISNSVNSSSTFDMAFSKNYIWNNITTPYTNKPADMIQNSGNIPVYMLYEGSSNTGIQVIFGTIGDDNGKIWMRRCDSGTWSIWKLVAGGGGGGMFVVNNFIKFVSALENNEYRTKYIYIDRTDSVTDWDGITTTTINSTGINYVFGNVEINTNAGGAITINFIGASSIFFMNNFQATHIQVNLSTNMYISINRYNPDSGTVVIDGSSHFYYETILPAGTVIANAVQSNWFADPYLDASKVYKTDGATTLANAIISSDATITDVITCTMAEYEALTTEQRAGRLFAITDGVSGGITVINNLTDGGTTNALSAEMGKYLASGWTPLAGTFTLNSADSPSFKINTSTDLTGILDKGMKFKCDQSQAVTAYFPMDSNSTSTVGSFTSTDTAMTYTAGKFGNAGTFNGTTSKVVITDTALMKPTGAFTIGCWFKSSVAGTYKDLFQSYSANTNFAGISLRIESNNTVSMFIGNNTGTTFGINAMSIQSVTNICDNNFHYVIFTYNNNYGQIYVDGKLDGYGYILSPSYSTTNYVRIGCRNAFGTDDIFMNGQIDDLFLINGYALDEKTIRDKYNLATAQGTSAITISKNAFITDLNATTLTLYCGTDFAIANSTITNNYYSNMKAPFGFPTETNKWSITLFDATNRHQDTCVAGTYYNLGGLSVIIPIGEWELGYNILGQISAGGGTITEHYYQCALSTSTSSVSDSRLMDSIAGYGSFLRIPLAKSKSITLTSPTTFYLIARNILGTNSIWFVNMEAPLVIRAVCAYL